MFKKNRYNFLSGVLILSFILFNAVNAFAGTATLSWSAPTTNSDGTPLTGLAGYKIYYGTSPGAYSSPSATVVNISSAGATSYTVNNLANGTYYFAMTALDTSGNESAPSTEVSKTIVNAPPVISGVYSSGITSSGAVINWTTDTASDSQVQYGTTTSYGGSTTLDNAPVTSHSQAIGGLSPSTLYHYRVLSRDAAGNLSASGDSSFTTAAAVIPPPVISNVRSTNITASSVTVTWSTDTASTSQVEYGTTTSYGKSTALDSALVTAHSVSVTGLSGFTAYDFRVRSKDAAGKETVSANYTFTTSNNPPAITSFSGDRVSGLAPLTVNFSAAASDTDGYIVSYEWDFNGDGIFDQNTGNVPGASYVYSNPGTYNAKVRVTDNGGATAVSKAVVITVSTPAGNPPAVSSLNPALSSGGAPLTVTFTPTVTGGGPIVKYEWDFEGSGTYGVVTTSVPASYTYKNPGSYTAGLRVTDSNGATARGAATITVTTDPPAAGTTPKSSGGGHCFIATAAYGSYLDPHVMVLREFRDKHLMTNFFGRAFVRFYYGVSPPLADFIAGHEYLRLAARVILTPLVCGVEYPVQSGIVFALIAGGLLYRGVRKIKAR